MAEAFLDVIAPDGRGHMIGLTTLKVARAPAPIRATKAESGTQGAEIGGGISTGRRELLLHDLAQQLPGIHAEHARNLNELDDVHAPLARFDAADEGMRAFDPGGKVALAHPGSFPGCHHDFNEMPMFAGP